MPAGSPQDRARARSGSSLQPRQGQAEGVLGHRPGVAALGARPRDPGGAGVGEDAGLKEMLYASHRQLHPTYALVSAKGVEQPV